MVICLLVTFQVVIKYFEAFPISLRQMSPGHCESVNTVNFYCVFVTPWRSSCEQGFKPVSGVSVWMLVWMPFSYRSCRFRRATELLGSPCKGPRVLYLSLWLGLCECFVRVNILVSDPTSCPVSSLFVVLSFRAFFGLARGVWIACILSYFSFWPFCRSRVNTG